MERARPQLDAPQLLVVPGIVGGEHREAPLQQIVETIAVHVAQPVRLAIRAVGGAGPGQGLAQGEEALLGAVGLGRPLQALVHVAHVAQQDLVGPGVDGQRAQARAVVHPVDEHVPPRGLELELEGPLLVRQLEGQLVHAPAAHLHDGLGGSVIGRGRPHPVQPRRHLAPAAREHLVVHGHQHPGHRLAARARLHHHAPRSGGHPARVGDRPQGHGDHRGPGPAQQPTPRVGPQRPQQLLHAGEALLRIGPQPSHHHPLHPRGHPACVGGRPHATRHLVGEQRVELLAF